MEVVITVSRQLGSRGSYVATAVAKALGLRYIDREILYRAAEKAGFPDEAMVAHLEQRERVPSLLERIIGAVETMPLIPTVASATLREGYAYDERLATLMVREGITRDEALKHMIERDRRIEAGEAYVELVKYVITEYAQAGGVIIVGRGGQVVLRDHPGVLHVRFHAPESLRIKRLAERLGLSEKEAERQIHQSDKDRARYLKHYFGADWNDPDLYSLILNTGRLSVETATDLIVRAAKRTPPSILETD